MSQLAGGEESGGTQEAASVRGDNNISSFTGGLRVSENQTKERYFAIFVYKVGPLSRQYEQATILNHKHNPT